MASHQAPSEDSVGMNNRVIESPIDDCPSDVDSDADCSYPSGVDSEDLEDYFAYNYAMFSFPPNKDKSKEIVDCYKQRLGIRSLPC